MSEPQMIDIEAFPKIDETQLKPALTFSIMTLSIMLNHSYQLNQEPKTYFQSVK